MPRTHTTATGSTVLRKAMLAVLAAVAAVTLMGLVGCYDTDTYYERVAKGNSSYEPTDDADEPESASASASSVASEAKPAQATEVSADLVKFAEEYSAFADEYEAFLEQYTAFFDGYAAQGNPPERAKEVTDWMSRGTAYTNQVVEWDEKVTGYNTSKFTDADTDYFNTVVKDVYTRVHNAQTAARNAAASR